MNYNNIAAIRNNIKMLEKKFSEEIDEEKRKRIFWEIERAYRKMDYIQTLSSEKRT
jgi:hypothetical protein